MEDLKNPQYLRHQKFTQGNSPTLDQSPFSPPGDLLNCLLPALLPCAETRPSNFPVQSNRYQEMKTRYLGKHNHDDWI